MSTIRTGRLNTKKRVLLIAMGAAALGGAGAFTVMAVKDQTYVPSDPYAPLGEPNREVAVVYYSRSGHSEAAARDPRRLDTLADLGLTPDRFRRDHHDVVNLDLFRQI